MACKIKKAGKSWDKAVDKIFDSMAKSASRFDEKVTNILRDKSGANIRNIFFTHEAEKAMSEVIRDFRSAKNAIYEEAAKIKDALMDLDEWQSQYLVRALNGDADPRLIDAETKPFYERFRVMIDKNADTLVGLGALSEKSKIGDYLKRYYAEHLESQSIFSKLYFDKRFKARKDLSLDERLALGMIEDASFVVPKTIAEQRVQILRAQMLKKLADKFGIDEAATGYTRISDETVGGGVYKYGALAEKYVPDDIAAALRDASLVQENIGLLERFWYPVIDHIKVNVTVKNPATHLYNIASNTIMAFLHGDLASVSRFLTMGKEGRAALVAEAKKYGLNSSLDDFEAKFVLDDAKRPNIVATILKNAYMSKGSKVGDAMRKAYAFEDEMFKLAAFDKNMREMRAELGRPLNDDEKRAAFMEASAAYVDYDTPLPAGIRIADKSGFFPFLHYTYKSTPVVAKTIAKHPFRAALLVSAMAALGASAIFNDDDDVLKPEWAANQFNLLGAKEWVSLGNGWHFNAGRLVPGVKLGHIDFSGGFVGGILDILQGETPLGHKIGSKYDTPAETVGKRGLALAENYAPPLTFGRYGQRTVRTAAGKPKKNASTGENTTLPEVYAQAAGVRKFDGAKEVQKKAKTLQNKYKHEIKDGESEMDAGAEYGKAALDLQSEAFESGVAVPVDMQPPHKKQKGGTGGVNIVPRLRLD